MERLATTPFGGAPVRARDFALRAEMARRQERLGRGEGGNETGRAEKWRLIRALTEAREAYSLSDRSIAVLEALTSFHQERELDGRSPIIVFPSNAELSIRARGMSPATLRRHLAALVEAGLIFRRDSANGKRFCRRDDHGQVETAFGFDLAPLALRSAEIFARADAAREEARRIAVLRAEITLHLRDISKIIEAGLSEQRAGDWLSLAERLADLSGRVQRNGAFADLERRRDGLMRLRTEVENSYLNSLTEEEMSANESDNERHIQNSNTDPSFDIDGQRINTGAAATDNENMRKAPERKSVGIGLKEFLSICPQIADYAKGGVKTWRDVAIAAEIVRTMLGISPSAWEAARGAMGETAAAITIAAILERAEAIRSPGGYLRDLTRKAEQGRFSVLPMLKALRP
ncbi:MULTISPECIES: plasmid replication protein RepC [Alphaproteobacteria]|uniref:Replication initiation protein n=2 Tax=Alphaproteobacteria TaxID=28211 RepID=A0A512HH13_9HYPH|nr:MULTISPECIES: plasmid replication protein RepC [Alphaproteobacteria]GEO84680.1 replication initiation protein [Ciceribacter naphthalenivorans]GLR20699.1 replication initiation protein [Ciceribacter naphthalenivorans]GLT03555.1 replication initiation protein [Sphingomonas psychrolutea]